MGKPSYLDDRDLKGIRVPASSSLGCVLRKGAWLRGQVGLRSKAQALA